MTLQLQMIQKPPVVFSHYDPCTAISDTDLAYALKWSAFKEDAIARLWLSYSRNVLSDVDPCMEANDGAAATIAYTAHVNGNCECSIFGKLECSVFRNSSTSFSVTMMQHFL